MRSILSSWRVQAIAFLAGLPLLWLAPLSPSHAQPAPDPADRVSREHWSYDAEAALAQAALWTGYPDGTFAGKRELPRSAFATALRFNFRCLEDHPISARRWSRQRLLLLLHRLVTEYLPDLQRQGVTEAQIRTELRRIDTGGSPESFGFTTGGWPPAPWPHDMAARARGAHRADEEWARGELVFEVKHSFAHLPFRTPYALPLRHVEVDSSDFTGLDEIEGHDERALHRLRTEGPPAGTRLPWLRFLVRQDRYWQVLESESRKTETPLLTPDGRWRLQTAYAPEDLELIELRSSDQRVLGRQIMFPGGVDGSDASWLWGPSGSGTLFFRSVDRAGRNPATHFCALDLRSERVLYHQVVPIPPDARKTTSEELP